MSHRPCKHSLEVEQAALYAIIISELNVWHAPEAWCKQCICKGLQTREAL